MATPVAVARVSLVRRPLSIPARAVARRLESLQPRPITPRPFIKWVGGKSRLLSQLEPLLPAGVSRMRHVEPFLGGGAMFFFRQPGRAMLSDVNPALVETYTAVRDDVHGVLGELFRLAARHSRDAYYEVREAYNAGGHPHARHAAMFIYLNKTCFNGLHRVNRSGEFNVPAGRYKNPKIVDPDALEAASLALQDVELRCESFEALARRAKPGDFVYFDPPYEPVSRTASFTAYAQDGFSQDDQARLRDLYRELDRRGCKLMLSNSDVPFIRELYREYRIDTVEAPRAINCNADGRGKVSEVVVRNYR